MSMAHRCVPTELLLAVGVTFPGMRLMEAIPKRKDTWRTSLRRCDKNGVAHTLNSTPTSGARCKAAGLVIRTSQESRLTSAGCRQFCEALETVLFLAAIIPSGHRLV